MKPINNLIMYVLIAGHNECYTVTCIIVCYRLLQFSIAWYSLVHFESLVHFRSVGYNGALSGSLVHFNTVFFQCNSLVHSDTDNYSLVQIDIVQSILYNEA